MSLEDRARTRLRVAAYNVHKCTGFDRRTRPERIAEVLREVGADVFCLQEVVDAPSAGPLWDQAGALARSLPGFHAAFGSNRTLRGGGYGNLTLCRWPFTATHNHDITARREPRGVLQADVEFGGIGLHLFNVHLGTGFVERRAQAHRLMSEEILLQPGLRGARLVLGDFNEWMRGLATRLLRDSFDTFTPRHAMRLPRTFPGMLPLLTLDHCYFEPPLRLLEAKLWRSRTALIASDHLPLTVELAVKPAWS